MTNEETGKRYSVLLKDDIQFKTKPVAEIISRVLGIHFLDAARKVSSSVGIVAENCTSEQGSLIVEELADIDIESYAVPNNEIVNPGKPRRVPAAELTDDLLIVKNEFRKNLYEVRWENIIMVSLGVIGKIVLEEGRKKDEVAYEFVLKGMKGEEGETEDSKKDIQDLRKLKPYSLPDTELILDIFAIEPHTYLRITRENFYYDCLGERATTSTLQNFLTLLEDITSKVGRNCLSPRTKKFLNIEDIKEIKLEDRGQYRKYNKWFLQRMIDTIAEGEKELEDEEINEI